MDAEELGSIVEGAARGEDQAWRTLVGHFSGLIWSVASAHGLSRAAAADVAQVTWLRLVEHLHRLRDPSRIGAWLVVTTRRECLHALRAADREVSTGDDAGFEGLGSNEPPPESLVLRSERAAQVWRAFEQLGTPCQELLRALVLAQPALSYHEVAEAFGMRIGSIGPTRARCLAELRRRLGSDVSTAP